MGSEKSFDSFLGIETIAETAFGDMDVCLPVNEEDNNYEVTYYCGFWLWTWQSAFLL